ncbi:MAG TPA: hypothetical protein VF006_20910 [Longimicrobium sp.]
MQRLYFAALSLVVLAACGDSGQLLAPPTERLDAASTETTSQIVPFSLTEFVPCAAGGAGEIVQVEGTLHTVFHITETPNGLRISIHENPQDVNGTGLTTGDTYHATGSFNAHLHLAPGVTESRQRQFLLVGPGPDNNFTVHQTSHITVTPDGDVTADFDKITIECR